GAALVGKRARREHAERGDATRVDEHCGASRREGKWRPYSRACLWGQRGTPPRGVRVRTPGSLYSAAPIHDEGRTMILVTGGAGYFGCGAARHRLERGEAARVYDKLYFGETGLADVAEKIDLAQGDIRHFDPAVLDGCNAVLHLAGLSNDPTAEFNPKA